MGDIQGEIRLPTQELRDDIPFFTKTLKMRLDMIFPADDPAVAVFSGHGLRLRIEKGAPEPAGTLRLCMDDPDGFADGARVLTAPNGTRIEIADLHPPLVTPAPVHSFVVRRLADQAPWIVGRAGMQYRDLIPDRLGGSIIASHIRIPDGGPVPDMVHYHTVGFQLIFCYRGWVDLVYEDQGEPFRLHAGNCVIQPPQIRHRVLYASDNIEVIEVGVPAEHVTTIDHEMTLPNGPANPDRVFGGQRFVHHRAEEATWTPFRLPGFIARDTGIAANTGDVAGVSVVRRGQGETGWATHDAGILFTFVMEGGLTLEGEGRDPCRLAPGDAFVIPPGHATRYADPTDDVELLEVALPGAFATDPVKDAPLSRNSEGDPMTQSVTRKHLFDLPEGVIYLDGNSLGPLPAAVPGHVAGMVADQWGQMLIKGWNDAGWFAQPGRVGDKIAGLIGAPAGSVMAGDTLSIKVYQALAAALRMNPDRRVVLSDSGNFPTDLYMAQGLLDLIGQGHSLRVVDPEAVAEAIDEEVAAVLLTQVDYRTGRRHDMTALTGAAHDAGAVMIWDLAHSAGAFEIDLAGSGCAFAVGCTYKYLNGGPGAPAFIYVRPDLADTAQPALQGWMGHNAPFAFDMDYQPAGGIARMRVGTPPVIQMSALEQALSVWDGVSLADVRAASVALMEQFIAEVEARCPQLTLASPRDPEARGSHVSFRFAEGYAAMQALIDRGVIGDFRAPDIMRFGFTPLYLDAGDITGAVDILADILATEAWRDPKYQVRGAVT